MVAILEVDVRRIATAKEIMLMCVLTGLFALRFDVFTAVLLALVIGSGIIAVKRRLTK